MDAPKTQPAGRPKPKPVPVKQTEVYTETTIELSNWEKFPFTIKWTGPVDAKGLPKGVGTIKCSDGRTYHGNWESKVYQGHTFLDNDHRAVGKITYPDGSEFEGTICSGIDSERLFWRGIGTYKAADGTVTKGQWSDNEVLKWRSSGVNY